MDYKSTLNLPKTPFPMRGNLPVKEKETLRRWEEIDLYGKMIRQRAGGPQFVLHDGPPYANGNIHLGTALNKILKDIIVRSKFMSGFRADYVPGWDCHGLPIEHQAEKEMKERQAAMTKMEVRAYCREYASRFLDIQREEFKRLGGVGDWDHPYITMDYAYQATIIEEMAKFFERGEVYRKKKPVYWCINCGTALAEAEIEYEMDRSTSIYVKFPLISRDEACERLPGQADIHAYMDDDALDAAREPRHRRQPGIYLCRRRDAEEIYIAVKDLVARHHDEGRHRRLAHHRRDLSADAKELPSGILLSTGDRSWSSPTMSPSDVGTGAVHIAPGHGEEDYATGLEYGLDVYSPVNEKGELTQDVPFFAGDERLRGQPRDHREAERAGRAALLGRDRAFLSPLLEVQEARHFQGDRTVVRLDGQGRACAGAALEEIDRATWIPAWGKERIYNMLSVRPDWCISRQRTWGVPIAIFYCDACREPYWSRETFDEDHRRGEEARRGHMVREGGGLFSAGRGCMRLREQDASRKRRTSSTSGSTPAQASRRC